MQVEKARNGSCRREDFVIHPDNMNIRRDAQEG
jgi:hypothetical protein